MILLSAQSGERDGYTRTRVIIRTKKSATSATGSCNLLNHRILWVHFDFWKMLLEKLLEGVSAQLRICALLCRNETYRKVTARLFYMSHREIFMRLRLFKKWRRLFEKRRRRFEKSRLRFGKSRRRFMAGSTCSIFGSTSGRPICTRKHHNNS